MVQEHQLKISLNDLLAHQWASGNSKDVVEILSMFKDDPNITFQTLTAIDLAGCNLQQLLFWLIFAP